MCQVSNIENTYCKFNFQSVIKILDFHTCYKLQSLPTSWTPTPRGFARCNRSVLHPKPKCAPHTLSYKSKQPKPTHTNPPCYYTKLEALRVSIFQSSLSNPTIPMHYIASHFSNPHGLKMAACDLKNIIRHEILQSQMHTQIVEIWKSTNLQIQKLNWKSFEFEIIKI